MAVVWKEIECLMEEKKRQSFLALMKKKETETRKETRLTDTDELGALVQYPDEGTDATDHLRPSALQKQNSNRLLSAGSPSHMKPTHPVDSLLSSKLHLSYTR